MTANSQTAYQPKPQSKPAVQQPPSAQQPAGPPPAEHDGKAAFAALIEGRSVSYVPMAEKAEVFLTIGLVRQHLCVPTKTGAMPTDTDCIKYIMVCRQRGLNPWVGDCYLLGYDQNVKIDNRWVTVPKFSMVVSIQALLKRAELARTLEGTTAFDGIESGVVVIRHDDNGVEELVEREGDLVLSHETLVGGWARVYRKDRTRQHYQKLKLETYQRETKIWKEDPAGMLCKCAEAAALRQAFPSDIGGLFLDEEIKAFAEQDAKLERKPSHTGAGGAIDLDTLAGKGKEKVETLPAGSVTDHVADHNPDDHDQRQSAEDEETGIDQSTGSEDVSNQSASSIASTEPVDLETERMNWLHDIDSCTTNAELNKLLKDILDSASEQLKSILMDAATKKRQQLSSGAKPNGNGSKSKQPALPGAN